MRYFGQILLLIVFVSIIGCNNSNSNKNKTINTESNIIFLHHSTGKIIWSANKNRAEHYLNKVLNTFNYVPRFFKDYNEANNTGYLISEQIFPKSNPYGWKNYPYDYYNIWVKNAGDKPYMEEPTLELLTKKYDVIIFKHCFPGSNILEDTGHPDINLERKSLENYKLQYNALKEKMLDFPDTKFIVWTIPALLKGKTTEENAKRAKEFSEWIKNDWDTPGDNIFIWDFRALETEGGLYLKKEFAKGANDSHPNLKIAGKAAPLFCARIIDIIETNGKKTTLTGETK